MRSHHVAFSAAGVLLAVIAYNLYALGCGRCACSTFWSAEALLGVAGVLLLAGTGLWLALRPLSAATMTCSRCGCSCAADWRHCPDCGASITTPEKGA